MALIWGTLCLLDTVPHEALTAEQEATLVDLAAMVVSELELRLAAQQIAKVDAALVEITQGVARVTGGEFFGELVRHFAKVLGADYVYRTHLRSFWRSRSAAKAGRVKSK